MVMPSMFQAEVQDSLVIQASKRQVFNTLLQWSTFPEWNPYITRIDGKPEVGQDINVVFFMGMGPRMPLRCKVLTADAQKTTLSWEYKAPLPWLYTAQHSFVIQEIHPGQCQITQKEAMQGLFACRLLGFLHGILRKRFQLMHAALRKQVKRSAA
ncbi:MAG TPA: SRPBCC domain-containing protein [Oligoflexus sp.]|uniref:SRPBCC domain-containing protein n=1 Tax=Oligoflexus sp. TaxID=1971216 RepID=UPI002D30D9F6|nr:SRPBCC domain-containing protein [Oligoflexus sp.]HYX33240.1 SRPBCC domain-containing protein [Oligoflexus sp.]